MGDAPSLQEWPEYELLDARESAPGGLAVVSARGMKWNYIATALVFILQLPYTATISRHVKASGFGLVALANLMLRFGSYFANIGIRAAIVQRESLTDENIRAAFALSMISGGVTYLALWFAAPFLAHLFHQDSLTAVIRALGLSFPISSLGATAQGLLRREFRFRAVAALEAISFLVAYPIVALALAFTGHDVWSLVWAAIAQSAVVAVGALILRPHSLLPTLRPGNVDGLFSFGGRVSLLSLLEFLSGSSDTLAVGRYSGPAMLGQYDRASILVALPVQQLATNASEVLLPAVSRIQSDRGRLSSTYEAGLAIFSAVVFPACAVIAVISKPLVRLLLGPQWGLASTLVPLVAVATGLDMVSLFPAVICEATARLNEKLVIQVVHLGTIVGLIAIAVSRGGGVRMFVLAWIIGQVVRQALYLKVMDTMAPEARRGVAVGYVQGAMLSVGCAGAAALGVHAAPLPDVGRVAAAGVLACITFIGAIAYVPGLRARDELRSRGIEHRHVTWAMCKILRSANFS